MKSLLRILCGLLVWQLAAPPARAQTLALHRYTTANGLPQTIVYSICQDQRGQLWVGTQGGVASFDGQQFRTYDGRQGLPDNHVRAVAAAPDGTIWLGHEYGGLSWLRAGRIRACRLPALKLPGHIRSLHPTASGTVWVATAGQGLLRVQCGPRDTLLARIGLAQGLASDSVNFVKPGPSGQLWVATTRGLQALEAATGKVLPATRLLPPELSRQGVNSFFKVSDTLFWCATPSGLLRLSRGRGAWQTRRYTVADGICDNLVLSVVQDRRGQVWATTSEGLCRAPAASGRFTCFAGQHAFDSDQAHDLLEDREGSLWIVDDNGLGQHLADERFMQYGPADGLPDNEVHAILKIRDGEYWVGTRLGIVALHTASPGQQLFEPVPLPGGPEGRFVRCLLRDSRGGIWLGTLGEGALRYEPRTRRWTSYNHVPGLRRQRIASLAEDRRGRIWLATRQAGVTVFDPATGAFTTYNKQQSGLGSNSFWKAFRDHSGQLWLGSDDAGLIRVDTEHDTFRRVDGQPGRLSVGSISEDQQGRLWLGSIGAGLLRFEPHTSRLRAYGLETGLQTLNPYFAQCDSAGHVWLGTNRGLDCFTIATAKAVSYSLAEGFAGLETNQNAVLLDQGNQLWVGTVNGLMHYNPALAHANRVAPQTQLTGLRVAFRDTTLLGGMALPYRLNTVAFDYIGVSLTNPGKVRYQYRLLGFDDDWVGPLSATSATYTNLPPGSYTFEVKAANNEGVWNSRPASFAFTVRPPWWRTWWAYLAYTGLFGLALYTVRANTRARERQRADRQLERQALQHLQELDRVKTDFFTNVSHEFRTPLTLIMGPAEELASEAPDASTRERSGLILRSARKLLRLINQLLDLSKLEAGALQLQPSAGDLAAFVRQLTASFASLAESREITLTSQVPAQPLPFVFDAAKLEDVLTNLLANALRFTPAGGQVSVTLQETPATVVAPAGGICLLVHDTGPGIEAQHLPHLFDRFYQVAPATAAAPRTGTGIGLALVRELTELHGGSVAVESQPGAGATFTIHLPRLLRATDAAAAEPTLPPAEDWHKPGSAASDATTPDAGLILIVEDNDDVRQYVQATLAPAGYRLLLAADGLAGLAQARAEVPDLVVSDVMMPGLNGYELCQQLKTDPATSHIPVVLLTAKSGPDARLEGLETGADSFLPKPFNPRELRAQVRNLLSLRSSIQARFNPVPAAKPAAPAVPEAPAGAEDDALTPVPGGSAAAVGGERPPSLLVDPLAAHEAAVAALPSLDQEFLRRVNESVLRHLDDEEFGVDQLGSDVAMSRTQVHRKLKALTGQSPGEYIRTTRLNRALALLRARAGTVAEVSYQVGFGSPTHFSTAFSKHFGYPPSAVAKQQLQDQAGV
ncbi:hybrid sensor histidine kinase/response regulator transcription factor [Hymenobacter saemangeumensis]|uniref:histidine kinase n=1 Tax=Hymenobacter saemangeumensis TaxID=1084522 RepID=A0ABP8HYD9_9BACT